MRKVSFVSFYPSHDNNNIFNINSKINRDNALEPFIHLKSTFWENNISLNTQDINDICESDSVIFLRLDVKLILKAILLNKKIIYIQFEPPVVMSIHSTKNMKKLAQIFDVVLTWNDDLVDNIKFFKFYFPVPKNELINSIPYKSKKLLVNISGFKISTYPNELYSKRIEAIKYFEENAKDQFDLFGIGWDKSFFPSYRGKIENKLEILKKYKFSVCYENMNNINGLISEKIFDCFFARCIPIFWGAENISDYIPSDCYIDKRKFTTYESLYLYILQMTEEQYNSRLQSIDMYLKSEYFMQFKSQCFSQTVLKTIKVPKNKKSTFKNYYYYYLVLYLFSQLIQRFLIKFFIKKGINNDK